MEHFSHKHSLILNETYNAKKGDICYGCNQQIVSCKLFVYSCIRTSSTTSRTSYAADECLKFLLHKSCAELPRHIQFQIPENPEVLFYLHTNPHKYLADKYWTICDICKILWSWFIYHDLDYKFFVCVKCAMFQLQSSEDRKFHHQAHSQHSLTLIQHLASFKCYACKVEDNIKDLSYICTKCAFWMHKNCADAPASFQVKFHQQHPLILSFSLPELYREFKQYCKFCKEELSCLDWLYCCLKCRFFSHFHCARSNQKFSFSDDENDSDLVNLPAADESAMNLLYEEFVKALSSLNHNDDNSIYSATEGIEHWSHDEHELQVMSMNELSDWKDDGETLLVCDGCVKPIRSDGGVFYGCVTCKYFLHKVCAELPRDIKHHIWPGTTLSAHKYCEPYKYNFYCTSCVRRTNGIYFSGVKHFKFDIGCLSLPKIIKHEAHRHQLMNQVERWSSCKACGTYCRIFVYTCEYCYDI